MGILIVLTEYFEKFILFSLFTLSIWSLSIIIDRSRKLSIQNIQPLFVELKKQIQERTLKKKNLDPSLLILDGVTQILISAPQKPDSIASLYSSFIKEEKLNLEKGLAVLATLGANAPFIGLFGTVLGIIRSFAYLGSQSGMATVMTGISQALYATAFGLFVAIPAVVAFNVFNKKIKDLMTQAEVLRDLYISELGR